MNIHSGNQSDRILSRIRRFDQAANKMIACQGQRPLLVGIDKEVLSSNIEKIRSRIGKRRLCAVLKGDAYGHRIDIIAPEVVGKCASIAIVDNREARAIRNISSSVCTMRLRIGSTDEVDEGLRHGLAIREFVHSTEKARELDEMARHHQSVLDIHVSLDVANLGRNGLPVHDEELLESKLWMLSAFENLRIVSIGCHLPNAATSNPNDTNDESYQALLCFIHCLKRICILFSSKGLPLPEISAFSSASSCAFGNAMQLESLGLSCFDRIGNSLFGLTSQAKHPEPGTGQVMHACTQVCDVVRREKGASIGYGGTYKVSDFEGEQVALLGIGWLSLGRYYQGRGKTGLPAFVQDRSGNCFDVLGRQSMNISSVEATNAGGKQLSLGQPVFITTDWCGPQRSPTVERLSKLMGGVQTEFVTSMLGGTPSSLPFGF